MLVRFLIFDEAVNDIVLQSVHNHWKEQHDEEDLQCLISLCPSQRPISNTYYPWTKLEYDENAYLHAHEAKEVDEALFQPPYRFRWIAIVS